MDDFTSQSESSVFKLVAKLEFMEHQLEMLQEGFHKAIADNSTFQEIELLLHLEDATKTLLEGQPPLVEQCAAIGKHHTAAGLIRIDRFEDTVNAKTEAINGMLQLLIEKAAIRSCKEVLHKGSGRYVLRAHYASVPFVGYCVADKFNGGWLVIQHRINGSLHFNRTWEEYRDGFGHPDGEMWIGLERLYQLTSVRPCELVVEVKGKNGAVYKYARYKEFAIGSEGEQYRLNTLGIYSGTLGDSLSHQKGMKFSTLDRDNDMTIQNCAKTWKGGWWFRSCFHVLLNAQLQQERTPYIRWYDITYSYSRMMIRPLD